MTTLLEKALEYARRGWYVFPCREKPGAPFLRNGETVIPKEKQPYTTNGLNDATLDEDQIRAWWSVWENAMIGVNAGKSNLFVVDIDKKHVNGLETFDRWNINDSAGLRSITPSGGTHLVFSGMGKSSTNAKTGIDTRGEGGYFIAPPSVIIEGEYPGEYHAFNNWDKNPGVIPDGLMSKLFPDKTYEYVRGNFEIGEGQRKQLSRNTLLFLVEGAKEGERNNTLFKVCADFIGCGYSEQEIRDSVLPVSRRIGLSDGEFEDVLAHALSKPRTASIPDEIQEKILFSGKDVATKITPEEQSIMEDAILACMLIDNTVIPVISDVLDYSDFQGFKNRFIYKTIQSIYDTGKAVDFLTVSNEVEKESKKIKMDDISNLINRYYTEINPENIFTYADIVRERATIRRLEALMDNKQHYLKQGNIAEIISNIETDISNIALYGGVKSTNILNSIQATQMVQEHTNKIIKGEIEQLKIGFEDYDRRIGGLYSNELVVCAARSGEGKSALALSILNHVALIERKPVALFSLEMSTHESICRLITQMTGLPFARVYSGKLNGEEWIKYNGAIERISSSEIYFDDTFGITLPEIRSKIRKLVEKDVKLIIIDQLEQIHAYEGLATHLQFDKIAYTIKDFTQEFNVPIILNHQLNRNITDRRLKNPTPQLSDLNQAGEKPANQVWVISHKKDDNDTIVQSKIKILKNRNGPRIDFPVVFVGDRMLFSNPVHEEDKYAFEDEELEHEANTPHWVRM